jgi:hypothetical protein
MGVCVVEEEEEVDAVEQFDFEEVEVQIEVGLTEIAPMFNLGTYRPCLPVTVPLLGGVMMTGAFRGVIVGGMTLRSVGGTVLPLLMMCHLFLTALSERPLKNFEILAHWLPISCCS